MNIKEQFIKELINELNDVNERQLVYNDKTPIDVCYVVSVIDQQIEKCTEFMEDISKHTYYINGYDEDTSQGYTNGRIRVLIEKPEDEKESHYMVDAYHNYCYYIEFVYDERSWGYCECTPEDKYYNPKHGCCGMGCDWYAPAFRIEKSISLGYGKWEGQAKDYWEYQEKFYTNEQNKNEEVEKHQKEQRIKSLEEQIHRLQKELSEV